ncbi:MAG TPA: hypothetical protein VFS30_11570 [Dehalococcoidia bacterium]|nr:hypothetical protein [Dehalococcoidia bacterium]
MVGHLAGIDSKLKRAKKHITDLKEATDAFRDSEPYELFTYDDADSGDLVVAVHVHGTLDPNLSALVGDALNNLRSPLDYLLHELTGGKGNDHVSFPISQTEAGFKSNLKGLPRMDKRAMDMLRATNAYKGGSGHGFWQLHQVNRREKHRHVMPVGAALLSREELRMTRPTIPVGSSGPPRIFRIPFAVPTEVIFPLEEGTILHRISAAERKRRPRDWSEVNVQNKFTFGVTFGENEILRGEPLVKTLADFYKLVDGTIKPFRPLLS